MENFKTGGGVILELDYDPFSPTLIDINDFQYLMPPITIVPPYSPLHVARFLNNLRSGIIEPSPFPSGIIQINAPWIGHENVTGVYPMFDLLPDV